MMSGGWRVLWVEWAVAGWDLPESYFDENQPDATRTGASTSLDISLPGRGIYHFELDDYGVSGGIYTFELDEYRSSSNGSLMTFLGRAGGSATLGIRADSVVVLPAGAITSIS